MPPRDAELWSPSHDCAGAGRVSGRRPMRILMWLGVGWAGKMVHVLSTIVSRTGGGSSQEHAPCAFDYGVPGWAGLGRVERV